MDRRKMIENILLGVSGLAITPLVGYSSNKTKSDQKIGKISADNKFASPIKVITIGAGNRGNTYGDYAEAYPNEMDIIGVAEPIPIRNQRYAIKHNIPAANRFTTWEHVFDRPKFADAVIISTPDNLHYGPCIAALEKGYDILLEKPISPSEQECRNILSLAKQTGRIVAVCHVLRYAPYFVALKKIIDSGLLGELISIQHFEPIQYAHMAHSYVRGNWHNSKTSTPIILAKSCHDLDILRWLVGKPCKDIVAFGSLKWFKKENAPENSTNRCTDPCPVEESCPYSAKKIYHRDREYTYVFDLPDNPKEHGDYILDQLTTTDYGRCVYRMDNDQPDHYVCSLSFENDVTANFSMEAFTSYHGRRTRIMGAFGDIVGNMKEFIHTDFLTGKTTKWNMQINETERYESSGHGGGDWGLVADWIKAVSQNNSSLLTSTIDASVESHIMGFCAEQSRKLKEIIPIQL